MVGNDAEIMNLWRITGREIELIVVRTGRRFGRYINR
jgi:hypothetical protein